MASKAIALAATLAATTATLLGNTRCTEGPGFWCVDLDSANRCAAKDWCASNHWNKPLGNTNDQICDLCQKAVNTAIDKIEMHENDAKAAVEQLCNYCSTPGQCRSQIEAHWDDVMAFMEASLDPKMICSAINMCQQSTEIQNSDMLTLGNGFTGPLLQPSTMIANQPKIEESAEHDTHIRFVPAKQPSTPQKCSKLCQDCVNFAQDVKIAMQDPHRLQKLTKTIQLICEELPMRGLCRLVLNKKVVLDIINKVNPIEVCQKSEVCLEDEDPTLPMKKGDMCVDCHDIIGDMQVIAEQDVNRLKNIIYNGCDLMPNTVFVDMCKQLSAKMAIEARNSLQNADLDQACSDLALCGKPDYTPVTPELYLSSKTCEYCEMTIEYIQLGIDSDMTSDELKAGLKEICDKTMPPGMTTMCRNFVDKHWDEIVADADQFLDDPLALCRKLHLCPRGNTSPNQISPVVRAHLDQYGPLPSECTFGPQVWCKNAEMEKLCKAEDYCKHHHPHVLGAKPCTFGPDFWCKSIDNAVDCTAVDYCSSMKLGAFSEDVREVGLAGGD